MKSIQRIARQRRWLAPFALCSTLVACGGGGGGDSGSGSTSLTLKGTAATGAAIAAGAVDAKCASGTGTATTAADGSFTVNIANATLPCLLRVTSGATVLHSLAAGSGASTVANITPLTQLVVAALAAGDPALFYGNFSGANAGSVTATTAATAVAEVVAQLKSAGIDAAKAGDPLTGSLVAASSNTPGNAYDQVLDAIKASSTTLTQLTATVVVEASATKPSLPADLLTRAQASNCAALRSGRYRVVVPKALAGAGNVSAGYFDLDASTLGIVNDDLSTDTLVSAGACRYTASGGAEVAVSQAGVIVLRAPDNSGLHMGIAFPEQSHAVAELAGDWNKLGFQRNGANTAYVADSASVTLDASGVATAISYCADVKTCTTPVGPTITISLNSAGGFTRTFADGSTDRAFAYRAGGGELMLVTIATDGSAGFWTHQRNFIYPVAGATTTSWDFEANNQLLSFTAANTSTAVIVSVDTVAGTFLRNNSTGTPGVTRPETMYANNPRPGYRFRAGTPVTASDGSTQTPRAQYTLQLRGMGVTPVAYPAAFGLSVAPPAP